MNTKIFIGLLLLHSVSIIAMEEKKVDQQNIFFERGNTVENILARKIEYKGSYCSIYEHIFHKDTLSNINLVTFDNDRNEFKAKGTIDTYQTYHGKMFLIEGFLDKLRIGGMLCRKQNIWIAGLKSTSADSECLCDEYIKFRDDFFDKLRKEEDYLERISERIRKENDLLEYNKKTTY